MRHRVCCIGSPARGHTEGSPVGGNLAALKSLYRPRLRYVPAPATGPALQPGWVVSFADGNLAFLVSKGIVTAIIGGEKAMNSIC